MHKVHGGLFVGSVFMTAVMGAGCMNGLAPSNAFPDPTKCNNNGNGQQGKKGNNSIIKTTPVAAKPNGQCPEGGVRIEVGTDWNNNNVLDAQEVENTAYVCNGQEGTDGQDGQDGLNALISTTSFGPGQNAQCPNGGVKIRVGLDADRDGVLDAGEVISSQTRFICNPRDGTDGRSTLFTLIPEAPGANCVHGGVAMSQGVDDDGDGTLDAEEIDSTRYVCNGSDGRNGSESLVSVTTEPPGSNCLFGGQTVSTGMDLDGDHLLTSNEITSTTSVCNGAPGSDGTHGTNALVRQETEAPGTNCPHGGTAVHSGTDTDNSRQLEDSEITSTTYVCHGAPGTDGQDGLNSLISTTSFGPGQSAECPTGGIKIQVGLDADKNGVLDEGEVIPSQTRFICNPRDGTNGSDGRSTLFTLIPEAPGANCVHGGVAMSQGVDDDGDGYLDAGEIDSTRYVCNGSDGRNGRDSLVSVTTEAPGANCPFGGKAITSGMDQDGDHLLTSNEITSTSYVCNGAPGSDGTNGTNALVRQETEAPGANCLHGGTAVHSGTDTDNSGQLEETEVTSTTFVCHGAPGADGHNSLVRTTSFGPGEHSECPNGGVKLETGLDLDRNGVLVDTEVDPAQTRFICNGANGADGLTTLVAMVPETAGSNCANGGLAVSLGVDDDRDTLLDSGEIDDTRYICNGKDGRDGVNSLVSVETENPGANCLHGGKSISTGLDLNNDGLLVPTEVKHTSYVCNGAPGTNGMDGLNSLIRQDDELAGANCPYGGIKVWSGLDLDRDGYLGRDEPRTINYVCNGAPGRDGHNTLFQQTEELAGTNCVAGGWKIESGLDVDDSGILDPGEAGNPRYVCNGVDGAGGSTGKLMVTTDMISPFQQCGTGGGTWVYYGTDDDGDGNLHYTEWDGEFKVCHGVATNSLVNVTDEPAGTNCTLGGKRIATGLDMNRNNTLDVHEETQVSYLCKGGGIATRMSPAAWGGVCPRGGLKVETGLDDNENGVLEDAEVDRTSYECNLFVVQVAVGENFTCALISDGTVRCWGANNYKQLGTCETATSSATPIKVQGLSDVIQITTGRLHTCALIRGGSIRCWGHNHTGQVGDCSSNEPSPPARVAGINDAVQISAGGFHTCAVLRDTTAKCWGANAGSLGNGEPNSYMNHTPVIVEGLSGIAEISSGGWHTCARLRNGSMYCWGENTVGQLGVGDYDLRLTPVPVPNLQDVLRISAQNWSTCALLGDATTRCWGDNSNRTLGTVSCNGSNVPIAVDGLAHASALAPGIGWHVCAILVTGELACWGQNSRGQIGITPSGYGEAQPHTVIQGVVGAHTGFEHSCAVLTDGTARCWGYSGQGRLGDGTFGGIQTTPSIVTGIAEPYVKSIAVGLASTCALLSKGTIRCWGHNYYGQLGDGTRTNSAHPVTVDGITNAVQISIGRQSACATLTDKTVWCWGATNAFSDGAIQPNPQVVPLPLGAQQVSVGMNHACASLVDGTAYCWGNNINGVLGDGTTISSNDPIQVSGLSEVAEVFAGKHSRHSCARLRDGTVRCWGMGGLIGDGSYTTSLVPSEVTNLTGVVHLSLGYNHTCSVSTDGAQYCWGVNEGFNYGTSGTSTSPIWVTPYNLVGRTAAGLLHTCRRNWNGSVECTGLNDEGQLGNGSTLATSIWVPVPGIATAVDIGSGARHTCALVTDGSVQCWGLNGSGQLGDGTTTNGLSPRPVQGL